MATPFEDWLRLQGNLMMPPPRPTAAAPPPFATSPYLTPQMRAGTGLPWGPLLGTEMAPDLGLAPPAAPAPAPAREMAPAAAPMGGGFANGFAPAPFAPPRPIARGRDPFGDFMQTVGMMRPPAAEASGFGPAPAPAPESAAPFFLSNTPGGMVGQQGGGYGGGMDGLRPMDQGQMQREAMLARRFPRAMQRVNQLRAMSQRRGY